ncbi:BON domain-containing protein [Methylomonas sp. UP202]|uniref:BON domain-containing protein n=1 Tax=Methylomonas sp. UP202 TaxID=3040943 RepID=UPI00247AD938|nr:BON domain-containing protein [Methylomonas sp. UP202]WGS88242.1 BON domain-containing protein [Methylomonas sp. UP202]
MKTLTKSVSALLVALTLLLSAGCASTNKHEGTGEYIDDSVITTKVKAQLFDEPNLRSGQINVETFKGVVQLSGFVGTRSDIDKAVSIARSVKGVESVKNDMRLK